MPTEESPFEPLKQLRRDLREAAKTLSTAEVRFLVDAYYQMQRDRIRAAHQARQASDQEEPHDVIRWLQDNTAVLERNIKSALDAYTEADPLGRWSRSVVGIGPVIAAGLLAHIDITRAPTVGHIWRYSGLDPTVTWEKGTKRPWNASLKRLCFLIGESFVKVSGHEHDVYGKIYVQRKALELERDAAGTFADQAATALKEKSWKRDTSTRQHYESGHLPPARLHLRAQRYAVKLFLSHWHHVAHEIHYGAPPPKPYILTQPGHAHAIPVPNWPSGQSEPKP
jgi:Transposase IS116/IS110/IS902 family